MTCFQIFFLFVCTQVHVMYVHVHVYMCIFGYTYMCVETRQRQVSSSDPLSIITIIVTIISTCFIVLLDAAGQEMRQGMMSCHCFETAEASAGRMQHLGVIHSRWLVVWALEPYRCASCLLANVGCELHPSPSE